MSLDLQDAGSFQLLLFIERIFPKRLSLTDRLLFMLLAVFAMAPS